MSKLRPKSPVLKWCDRCNKTYGLKFFPRDLDGKWGRGPICKSCLEQEKEKNKMDEFKQALTHYAKREDVTVEYLLELYKKQDGGCGICARPYKIESISKRGGLFVDHCHTSGKVRGLLCLKCNSGLGMFDDNILILREAIDYLNNSEK